MVSLYRTLRQFKGKMILGMALIFLATISAILSIGWEPVANYELFNADQVAGAQYACDNTQPEYVFLINTRHNNAITALCGAGTTYTFTALIM